MNTRKEGKTFMDRTLRICKYEEGLFYIFPLLWSVLMLHYTILSHILYFGTQTS